MKGITGCRGRTFVRRRDNGAGAIRTQVYVDLCRTEVIFTTSEIKQMNCNDGDNFVFGSRSPENDFVVHQRVNQNVDMSRPAAGVTASGMNVNTKFMSLELLIHNRVKGGTCFFAAKDVGTRRQQVQAGVHGHRSGHQLSGCQRLLAEASGYGQQAAVLQRRSSW